MSGGGTQGLARLLCAPAEIDYDERFGDLANGATVDTGDTPWSLTPTTRDGTYGVVLAQHELHMHTAAVFETTIPNARYTGKVLIQFVYGSVGDLVADDSITFTVQVGSGAAQRIGKRIGPKKMAGIAQAVVQVAAGQSITVRAQVVSGWREEVFEISRVVVRSVGAGVSWFQDFASLAIGATSAPGNLGGFTRQLNGGVGRVQSTTGFRIFRLSSNATITTNETDISQSRGGTLTVEVVARTRAQNHENSDRFLMLYRFNGGIWDTFADRNDDFEDYEVFRLVLPVPQSANTFQLQVSGQSSSNNEQYFVKYMSLAAHC